MTSSAAVVGLTFDGFDIQDLAGGIFLEIARGLNEPPAVRGVDVVVPSRPGRIEGSRVNDVLSIELTGVVMAEDVAATPAEVLASYRSNQRLVRALFATNRRRATLEATLEDGSVLAIEAHPLNAIWNEGPTFAKPSIELEGFDDWVETEVEGS